MVNENISLAIILIAMFIYWAIMMYALWDPKETTQNETNGAQK